MLTMLGSPRQCCDGITRRETLKVGALSALGGFGLTEYLHAKEQNQVGKGPAKSVILLYLLGGAPTQDMYDLKPQAPAEVRGDFKPIKTTADGIEVCELMPETAKWMKRAAIVRSVNHRAGCHNTLPSYTGYEKMLPSITTTKESYPPSMGSICQYLNPDPTSPDYVYMPCYLGWGQSIRRPGPYGGFLGKRYDPIYSECKPFVDNPPERPYHAQVLRGEPQLPNTRLHDGITIDRLNRRKSLLTQIDEQRAGLEDATRVARFSQQRQQAWNIITTSKVRDAFNLQKERPEVVESYGNSLFGKSALVARRLVETGVRFVNVTWDCYWERLKLQYECWDTHKRNTPILKNYNLPWLDRTYGALMSDLDGRGLLNETLVVVMSDFGRTPKINKAAGRDHWTHCYSVLFAGAGIRGGTVYGASDNRAAYPIENPVSTGDICATIYRCLGIDPKMRVPDRLGRPIEIAHGGRPIKYICS